MPLSKYLTTHFQLASIYFSRTQCARKVKIIPSLNNLQRCRSSQTDVQKPDHDGQIRRKPRLGKPRFCGCCAAACGWSSCDTFFPTCATRLTPLPGPGFFPVHHPPRAIRFGVGPASGNLVPSHGRSAINASLTTLTEISR